ncbi:MAG: HIT family protein [Bacteroidales bacterium]|nr:HIT family protein [Bacteroidales bacterium]
MSTIFTKIINREIPAYIVAEDERFIAFLDVFPIAKGHVLVVPKIPVDYIFNLEDDILSDLHVFSKKVAKAVEKVIPCKRIGIAVIGLEVPHTHIHLVPINSVTDIDFSKPKLKLEDTEMKSIAQAIIEAI